MTSTQVITPTRRVGTPAGGGYRLDIDGLRALAIALVVVYHVWFGRVSGGVDVFLMVSAYFMTASLVRRVSAAPSQRVVVGFWVHRFARLIPAAAAAIAGTLALAWAFMPASTWESLWSQAWASLFYVQNWELASSSVDYYSRDGVSPLQHFWSLSIQGQVFIVWPVLIVVVMRSALRHGWNVQRALAVLFGVIFVGSLTYSVIFTAEAQQAAYFNTFARLWEFAVGSLLALATPYVRLAAPVAAVLGWLGIVGLVSCGALLDVRGGFPGYLALWPLLSAAAVMIAGATPSEGGPRRLLESRLLQSLGRVAYPLYLVHWPILIVYLSAAGVTSVDAVIGSAIIGVSLVVAWLVARLIERPARAFAERSQRRGVAAIVVSILVVAVPLGAWQSTEDARASQPVDADQHPGAATLLPGAPPFVPDPSRGLVPLGSALGEEFAAIGEPCSADIAESVAGLVESCRVRESARPDGPRIAIVGDSHAGQWGGPLIPILESQDWSAVTLVRGGCPFAPDEPEVPGSIDCPAWRAEALDYLRSIRPDVVFMMGSKAVAESPQETPLAGIDTYIDALLDEGIRVVLLRDNPRFDTDMFACVERYGPDSSRCMRDVDDMLARLNPAAGSERDGVMLADLTDYLCPAGLCRAVIGGVVAYLDDNHITKTYGLTMSPALALELRDLFLELGYDRDLLGAGAGQVGPHLPTD